jgi:hypothetical protein
MTAVDEKKNKKWSPNIREKNKRKKVRVSII